VFSTPSESGSPVNTAALHVFGLFAVPISARGRRRLPGPPDGLHVGSARLYDPTVGPSSGSSPGDANSPGLGWPGESPVKKIEVKIWIFLIDQTRSALDTPPVCDHYICMQT
jgi:hypothetical protein